MGPLRRDHSSLEDLVIGSSNPLRHHRRPTPQRGHFAGDAAGFHRAPATALVLARVGEKPAAGGLIGAAGEPEFSGARRRERVDQVERDAFERERRIVPIGAEDEPAVGCQRLILARVEQPRIRGFQRVGGERRSFQRGDQQVVDGVAQRAYVGHEPGAIVARSG